ncbi:MAG TPA: bifunctional 5,10-methylenetetrahydrofolate dehydrogenase/5,10-methenyltetrahydrofolate cyclohydrolase [Firmicutes bacterium]|nr:bifunctional 5,10-methylenetetrahydrofolate dehydrogenase/5,10-methenyltetrahydrofolate cyclohydrolase [Bacillota bacterium]
MAVLLKGKPVADAIKLELKRKAATIKANGIMPKLGIIRVGSKPEDLFYEKSVIKSCAEIGIDCQVFVYENVIGQPALEKEIAAVVQLKNIHGILMFAPLPGHLDEVKIRSLIPFEKDVDCLTLLSAGKVFADDLSGFPPCTPTACLEIIKYYGIPVKGKKVVVLGRSLVVGKPVAMLLLREHGTVTICHSRSENLASICSKADILVAAVGKPRLVTTDYVKEGQVIIDVGINEDPDSPGKYCGDVDFASVEPLAGMITPVPGGVGSVTTAVLCKHTVQACIMQTQ